MTRRRLARGVPGQRPYVINECLQDSISNDTDTNGWRRRGAARYAHSPLKPGWKLSLRKDPSPPPPPLRHKQKSRCVTHSQTILQTQHQRLLCDWVQIKVLSRLTSVDLLHQVFPTLLHHCQVLLARLPAPAEDSPDPSERRFYQSKARACVVLPPANTGQETATGLD